MNKHDNNKSYFELSEHSSLQVIIFVVIFVVSFVAAFHLILPVLELTIATYLKGRVFNAGEMVEFSLSDNGGQGTEITGYYSRWAIDIYLGTNQESRYWFVPIISLFFPIAIISLVVSVGITTLLSPRLGYIRQKIEREIAKSIDKISVWKDGFANQDDDIKNQIRNAGIKELYELQRNWNISFEDLKVIQKALKWQRGSVFYKTTHIAHGLGIYMRFYFTEKYSNTMLGLVYIGAAVLIIIIGMRGLKFIPSTQPSFVFLALGLEFSLLLTYALTLIFARQEDDSSDAMPISANSNSNVFLSNDFGNSKEVENLLRVFIKSGNKKSDD